MKWLLALALLAVTTTCMFEPANETTLGSQRELVTFRGVAIVPRALVTIQAAAAPNGPFAQIGSTFASGAPVQLGGATLYEFEVELMVPVARWAQTCAGHETFVRALGGALVFTTYDSAAITGVEPGQCILDALDAGAPFVVAAATCASDFGPPARLRTASGGLTTTVLNRSLRIVNPHQAEDYECLTEIDGNLAIVDPTPTDVALPDLALVTGNVQAVYPRSGGTARTIDLPALAEVGGNVAVSSPFPAGGEGSAVLDIDFGLPALAEVGGNVSVEYTVPGAFTMSVDGFAGLTELVGDLSLANPVGASVDAGLGGLLPALASVGGDVTLQPGLTLNAGALDELVSVGGDLAVIGCTFPSALSGLSSLTTVGGDALLDLGYVVTDSLPALVSVGGGLEVSVDPGALLLPDTRYFPALADVGDVLRIFENPAPIDALGSTALDVGGLALESNPNLSSLAATVAHIDVANTGPITITDNPNITDCEAQDWVDSLPGHNGPVTIAGNGPC